MKNLYVRHFRFLFLLPVLLFIGFSGQSQQYNTIYWMQGIPQSAYSNPGMQPNPNYYVGLPGISSLYLGFVNTGFAPMDIIRRNEQGNFYIDDTHFLSKLNNRNYLKFDLSNDILGFGFRFKGKNYFSFNVSERVQTRLGYSGDFMRLVVEGNEPFRENGATANIDVFSLDVTHFREFGFTFSRQWTDDITAGVRVKVLQGMGNVQFARTGLGVFTDPESFDLTLSTDLLVNKSLPFMLSPIEEIGDRDFEFTGDDMIDYITNTANLGFGLDIGGVYKLNDEFTFAASVRDLGYMRWNCGAENIAIKGDLEFDGLDINDVFGLDEERVEEITDSIIDLLNLEETRNGYLQVIPPRVFLSAAYSLTTMHKFAVLGRGTFYDGIVHPSVTLSYNFQPINRFGTSLSYSVMHGNFSNVGFGAHVNIFPVQLYMVLDNFLPAMRPHTMQTFNVHFGINIAAGFSKKQQVQPITRWRTF